MQSHIHTLIQTFRKVFFILALVCSFSFLGWFSPSTLPSYASHNSATTQTQESQAVEDREEAYEEAKEIVNDVQMGVEKEYEKEAKAYRQENPGGGIIEEAKELVTKATGK